MVGLATEDVDLFVEGDGGMLKSASRRYALRAHRPAPLKAVQVEDQQVVEPELAIATTEDVHLVFNDAGGVELSHGGFAPDYARDVEAEPVNALLEVDENDVREHLESVPATVDDDLTPVPNLTGVAHARLGQLVLVNFWLRPCLLLYIINII